jgi:hypothetical protein
MFARERCSFRVQEDFIDGRQATKQPQEGDQLRRGDGPTGPSSSLASICVAPVKKLLSCRRAKPFNITT